VLGIEVALGLAKALAAASALAWELVASGFSVL